MRCLLKGEYEILICLWIAGAPGLTLPGGRIRERDPEPDANPGKLPFLPEYVMRPPASCPL